MHKKTRKHSALLLLMAPVIAIGSSALVAGTAGAAGATAKKVASPTINICESVPGAFRFAINANVVSLRASCGSFKAKVGVNLVSEVSAPALYRSLSSISVNPAAAQLSASLRTATVKVRLAAGKSVTVRFVNSRLVVEVPSQPVSPPPSNPAPVSPPPSSPAPSGPSSPPVTNPQPTTGTGAGTGYIEVCKNATSDWVEGSFPFTITSGTTLIGTYSVAVGSCTGAIAVPAGTVTVTEAAEGQGYSLEEVLAAPSGNLGTVDLTAQTASFIVAPDLETTADFVNTTNLNWIKVCKTLSNNEGNLAGQTFDFNVAWTFTPANGAAPISESGTVGVLAVAAPGTACTIVDNWEWGIPVGSVVTVTEEPNVPDVMVTGVSIVPSQFNDGSTATSAVLTVPPVASGFADANFWNDPMGWVEVCKDFSPSSYDATNSASFSVNGATAISVQGGTCSSPIEVPAGTATVSETVSSNFYLTNVTTVSASDPLGTRLLTGATANPATVAVPYGNVGTETVVTFTNTVDPTEFKICKQETSADAQLSGSTFYFDWSYTFDGVTTTDSAPVALTIGSVAPGLVCSGLIEGPPAVDEAGHVIPVAISEEDTSIPGVQTDSIAYQGAGKVAYDSTDGGLDPVVISDGYTAAYCIDPGPGINVVTYTNGRTPGYVAP